MQQVEKKPKVNVVLVLLAFAHLSVFLVGFYQPSAQQYFLSANSNFGQLNPSSLAPTAATDSASSFSGYASSLPAATFSAEQAATLAAQSAAASSAAKLYLSAQKQHLDFNNTALSGTGGGGGPSAEALALALGLASHHTGTRPPGQGLSRSLSEGILRSSAVYRAYLQSDFSSGRNRNHASGNF